MSVQKELTLRSPHRPAKVMEILAREMDPVPSVFRPSSWRAKSRVCGTVRGSRFEVQNRLGAGFSLIAKGTAVERETGSELRIRFSKPRFPDVIGVLFGRYEFDRRTVLSFLKTSLQATELPGGSGR